MTDGRDPRKLGLDADVNAELDSRMCASQDGDEALIARVKSRVMAAVQGEVAAPNRTVRARDGWQEIGPGIERKLLWDADGARSCMMRFAPGTMVPAHVHGLDEECVVLEGSFRIGREIVLHAGDFHVGRRGTSHEDAFTDTGVVVYLRGAVEQL
ncbi:MAG: cupin domain-containing protein [Pseudomonadota bacterium]